MSLDPAHFMQSKFNSFGKYTRGLQSSLLAACSVHQAVQGGFERPHTAPVVH